MLKEDFGDNLAKRREALDLERKDLHKKAGVSVSQIGYIENKREKNNPTLDIVERLSEALGVPAWRMLLPPDQFEEDQAETLFEFCRMYEKLSEANRDKVLTYMQDLLAAQGRG